MNRHDHPTADAYTPASVKNFPISVWERFNRNLNLLAETGEIRKLTCGDGAVHFDGDTRQHYHFVCSECNQVYDMELGAMEDLNKEAQEHAPGIIDSHYVLFYGRCNSCLQKKS